MKRPTAMYLLIFLLFMGFLSSVSCKKNSQGDPSMKPGASYRILSGTANPSTLYVPRTNSTVSSHITVTATNNDGTPVAHKNVVFQAGNYGYFDGNQISDVRETTDNGVAEINFYIPSSAAISTTETVYITATLVDDTAIESAYSQVSNYIPIVVIPYIDKGFLITGHVYTQALVGIGEVVVQLLGADGHASGTTVSLLPSGVYEFYVSPGWYGTIQAGTGSTDTETALGVGWAGITASDDYTFTPTSYTIGSVTTNVYNQDFIATSITNVDKLSTDILIWDAPNDGGSQLVNVYNLSQEAQIAYVAIPDSNWLTVSPSSGTTPGNFTMTADENTTTATRSGKVTISATNTTSTEVVITVNQLISDVTPSLAATPADIYVPASGNVKYTVTVSNPTTDDVLNWTLDCDATWIGLKPTSGDTMHNDEFEVKVQGANPDTTDRVAKIYITATYTGGTAVAIVKVRQEGS